jgi:multiple sugar transport system substrate-binding protein
MIGNRRGARLRTMLGIPLALTLVVAACGSDADDDADSGTDTGDSTAEPATTDGGDTDEPSGDGDRVEIRWFVGLGTGAEAEQIDRQEEFVAAFNESQDSITLVAEYVDNDLATDQLATQIAAGNAPDIVGPVGLEGSNKFAGQYLDLEPLIESSGFDTSIYSAEEIEVWREEDGELTGLPFASYPSAIFYNTDLFDEAGLPYPPAEYGDGGISTYGEGTEYEGEWNWDKLTEIAEILAVDANGNDATSPDYDIDAIEQWGYVHQWSHAPAAQGTAWEPGRIEQEDGTAKVPEAWVAEWKWYNDLTTKRGIAPTYTYQEGDILAGNPFASGRIAMANTHLWYTCCAFDGDGNPLTNWDLAALPNYEGTVVSRLHGDNFRIMKDTEHPEEAFTVLSYMLNEGALDLLTVYGAMPARADIRDAYFANLDEQFTQGVNWDVIIAGLEYPDVPNHQANMTNFLESDARIKELDQPLITDAAIDIDAEVARLEADLEALWGS